MPRNSLIAAALSVLTIGLAACGDDDASTSPTELAERLPAAQEPWVETEREFEWDNATDFVVQGLVYPEETKPSTLIDAIDDAGYEGGAGTAFTDAKRSTLFWIMVAEFDSEDGAVEARDRLHEEDLKQPCFAACVVNPEEHEVDGIPDSVAVHQVPSEGKPPPGLGKFEGYLLEFTVGSRLYVITTDGPPGFITDAEFDEAATDVYEQATAS